MDTIVYNPGKICRNLGLRVGFVQWLDDIMKGKVSFNLSGLSPVVTARNKSWLPIPWSQDGCQNSSSYMSPQSCLERELFSQLPQKNLASHWLKLSHGPILDLRIKDWRLAYVD